MIALALPYPISTNRYWRNFRGRQVVSAEARAFKSLVAWSAKKHGLEPILGKVALILTLHPKKPKKASKAETRCLDLDNCMKVAIDALNGVAYLDDSQIVDLHILRGEPVKDGALNVIVQELTPSIEVVEVEHIELQDVTA